VTSSTGAGQLGSGNDANGSTGVAQSGPLSAAVSAFFAAIGADFPFTLGGAGGNSATSSLGVVQVGGGNSATGSSGSGQLGTLAFAPAAAATPARSASIAFGSPASAATSSGAAPASAPAAEASTPSRRTQRAGGAPPSPRATPRRAASAGRLAGVYATRALPFTGIALGLVLSVALALAAAGLGLKGSVRVRR
jgi:hypothetical protein